VHLFLPGDLAVAVLVEIAVVPDDARVGVVHCDFAVLFDHGLEATVGDGLALASFHFHRQFGADVAPLGGIDAPQVTFPFAVFGVLPDRHIHQAFINDRGGDQLVPRAAAAENVLRGLGIGVELPEQLGLAVLPLVGLEAVEVAVAAGE
jgi:hypothetical protein